VRVAVIGSGYVGAVTAGCLATLGNEVVGHDVDRALIASLQAGRSPLHEAGLDEVLDRARRSGCLRVTDAVADAVDGAEVVFLCVGTPARPTGEPDLSQLRAAVTSMAPRLGRHAIDATRLAERMVGTFVLDPRGALDADACARAGLHVVGSGWEAPAVTPLFGDHADVGRRTA
jgi:predicted dinucleotide-binding enzyme